MPDNGPRKWILFIAGTLALYFIGYQVPRHETLHLFAWLTVLFTVYAIGVSRRKMDFRFWMGAALIWRLVLMLSIPSLSDDVFRFIWDGRMLVEGLNPFEYLPEDVLGKYRGLDLELYSLLNSRGRPTIYPPLSQLVFYISAQLSPGSILGSIIVMRAILLFGELGTVMLILWLLRARGMNREVVFLYALNPLVILEITGNLHFEGLMIFFMLLGVALLFRDKPKLSAVSWGLAVAVKLLPLIFLPLFIWRLGWKKAIIYGIITIGVAGLAFLPLLSREFLFTMKDAIGLYFVKFEFNASVYYLIREYGFYQKGWNMIEVIGPRLALTTFLLIMGYSYLDLRVKGSLYSGIAWILLIYLSLAMIVHPWYLLTAVAFSVFTKWRWPLLWSGLVFLSYEGYTSAGYIENYWLIAAEYVVLAAFIFYELKVRGFEKK